MDIVEKSIGKLIGDAKRVWSNSKKVTEYSDKLDKEESALFKEDNILADLMRMKSNIDNQIIDHIDDVINVARDKGSAEAKKYLFFKQSVYASNLNKDKTDGDCDICGKCKDKKVEEIV